MGEQMEALDWNIISAQIAEFATWEYWQGVLQFLTNKSLALLFILFFTWLAMRARHVLITRVFSIGRLPQKQRETLQSLLLSVTRYAIYIIAILMVLSNLGIEVGPIIAGAGVLGLAIGFGAQTLVKDFITGFFIIFEDQFSVGDYVSINNGQITGTVVSVGLRATKIRTWAQHMVVIQNSAITVSQNYNRERMRAIVYITVPYETETALVESAINRMSSRLVSDMPEMFLTNEEGEPLEPPQMYGVTDIENQALGTKYAIISLVKDQYYFTACKEIRKRIVAELLHEGVKVAYPRYVNASEPNPALHGNL